MRQVIPHATRLGVISFFAALFAMLSAIVAITGCGPAVREIDAQREARYAELARLDPAAVLAGRGPATVLLAAMSRSGGVWLEKGLLFPSEVRIVVKNAAFDPSGNRLRISQYYQYPWGPGTDYRENTEAVIPLDGLESFLSPPDPRGSSRCWGVDCNTSTKGAILVHKYFQFIRTDTVSDDKERNETATFWHLYFTVRETAVDAWAALKTLAR
ncbi:hypothetical protein [Pseudodesulfovibrio methanolicus]|uniref:Lipoprotein n=1 Tax=Pseudodesulfovibrio methanolicus TaxID=3126690 RepID=A0ABZ2IRF3_9BACT